MLEGKLRWTKIIYQQHHMQDCRVQYFNPFDNICLVAKGISIEYFEGKRPQKYLVTFLLFVKASSIFICCEWKLNIRNKLLTNAERKTNVLQHKHLSENEPRWSNNRYESMAVRVNGSRSEHRNKNANIPFSRVPKSHRIPHPSQSSISPVIKRYQTRDQAPSYDQAPSPTIMVLFFLAFWSSHFGPRTKPGFNKVYTTQDKTGVEVNFIQKKVIQKKLSTNK